MRTWIALTVLGLGWPGFAAAPGPATLEAYAYYTAPLTDALPPVLTSEFPPEIVCVLAPELCAEELEAVSGPIEQLLGTRLDPEPVQLVMPGTLPVTLMAGQPRHVSAIGFGVPEPPEGMRLEQLEIHLNEAELGYTFASPAFREVIEAVVAQADEPSPEPFADVLARIADGQTQPLAAEFAGVEACPIVEPWRSGDNQDVASLPALDCTFGTSGMPEGGTWVFDITLAGRAWANETVPPLGLAIRPMGPANLAYGDPDLSAWFHLAFATSGADGPKLVATYAPVPEVRSAALPGAGDEGTVLVEIPLGLPELAAPAAAPTLEAAARTAPREPTAPYLPWWYWSLVPVGLAAAVLYRRALRDDHLPVAVTGALTSLLEREGAR